jgi:hypothetical protein
VVVVEREPLFTTTTVPTDPLPGIYWVCWRNVTSPVGKVSGCQTRQHKANALE